MEADSFIILCKFIVLFIYGTICILSIFFTFAIEAYIRLEDLLNLEFLSQGTMNPLKMNVNLINDWLVAHHKIIGPMLMFVSFLDIVMFFNILNSF